MLSALAQHQRLVEMYRADARGMLAPRDDRAVRVSTSIETTIAQLVDAEPAPSA